MSCEIEIQSGADARGPLFEVDAGSHDAADVADAVVGVLPSGDDVSVWVDHPTDELNSALSNIGLEVQRDLYKMAVDLPLATTSSIDTRPFKPRQDESAWMEVNNRAFSWHREQ